MIHLFVMIVLQLAILVGVGDSYIAGMGAAALTIGAFAGLSSDGRYRELFRRTRRRWRNFQQPTLTLVKGRCSLMSRYESLILVPMVILLPDELLARMDAVIGGRPTDTDRRRWVMHVIREELSREERGRKPFAV